VRRRSKVGTIYNYPGADDHATYDLENSIADPEKRIEQFMESIAPFDGLTIADIGAGGGYHASLYAMQAQQVFAIEPAPKMLAQLYSRLAAGGLSNVSVLATGAENIPLMDEVVDVIHSRFAYFFGPEREGGPRSCEPGIKEALRILKPGGYFFIVDNSHDSGQFGSFLEKYGYTQGEGAKYQQETDRFYERLGFSKAVIVSSWTAPDRESLARVVAMEFPGVSEAIMSEVEGSTIGYHYVVYYIQKQ
jgi:ubiquinone/menaquinone biosynthesis C-methylase UbiE